MQSAVVFVMLFGMVAAGCPSSHPLSACGRCWVDAAQAASGGCTVTGCGGHYSCGKCWSSQEEAAAAGCVECQSTRADCNLGFTFCQRDTNEDGTCSNRLVCRPLVPIGSACGVNQEEPCKSVLCDTLGTCSLFQNGVCEVRGERPPCETTADCNVGFEACQQAINPDGTCNAGKRVCTPLAAEGVVCVVNEETPCLTRGCQANTKCSAFPSGVCEPIQ